LRTPAFALGPAPQARLLIPLGASALPPATQVSPIGTATGTHGEPLAEARKAVDEFTKYSELQLLILAPFGLQLLFIDPVPSLVKIPDLLFNALAVPLWLGKEAIVDVSFQSRTGNPQPLRSFLHAVVRYTIDFYSHFFRDFL
jgi:hypothetical protein